MQSKKCPDCGVKIGQKHKPNCDIERCPICKKQLISCGHKIPYSKKEKWTGNFPSRITKQQSIIGKILGSK